MGRPLLFLHKLATCKLCTNSRIMLEKAFGLSRTRCLINAHSVHTKSHSLILTSPKLDVREKKETHFHMLNDHVHSFKQHRHYCTKDFDAKNDPETRSLLDEIISDFESVKQWQKDSEGLSENSSGEKPKDSDEEKMKDDKDEAKYQSVHLENEDVRDFVEENVEPAWVPPISLKRGESGVFDLEDLVTLLEKENGQDIAVIEIPPEARFADHMVIVSALSVRHLRNMSTRVRWMHKQRKGDEESSVRVEGFDTAPDWHAMDLGNIILHLFLPETRELYDLETLWTNWGKPGQVEKEDDPYRISPEDDFWNRLEPQHVTDNKKDPN